MQAMTEVFKGMFGRLDIPIVSRESLIDLEQYIVTFIIAAIGATSWPKTRFVKLQNNHVIQKVYRPMTAISLLILMLMTTGYLVDGSFNPFLYFRF